MIDLRIDKAELEALVAKAIGKAVSLTPLKVRCTYPVFKGDGIFVKVGPMDEWSQTVELQRQLKDCPFFARLLVTDPIEYLGYAVFISEWRAAKIVFPEDFTDAQIESFVSGCVELSKSLSTILENRPNLNSKIGDDYATLVDYAARHRLVGRLLRPLLSIPESERTFGSHPVTLVHGDFHAKNFAFGGDRFSTVYDFDKLRFGLACGDLVNALVERFSLLSMSRHNRRRLGEVTKKILARQPWPMEEIRIVVNLLRLQFAARRIRKHPNSIWVVFDILRRDRRILSKHLYKEEIKCKH